VSRRHRLQLEYHTLVSSKAKSLGQALLGKAVILVCSGADETYRPPYYRGSNADPELILGPFTQVPENPGDQILKPEPPPKHISALQAAAAQEALERLDKPAFRLSGKIALDTRRPGPGFQGNSPAFFYLFKVQQGTVRIGYTAGVRELSEVYNAGAERSGNRAVSGSEINTNSGHDAHAAPVSRRLLRIRTRQQAHLPLNPGAATPGEIHFTSKVQATKRNRC
jgi:hypothetical protein